MDTRQLLTCLARVSANSLGVYAADRIPRVLSLPAAVVANMDDHRKKGSHWIAIYIDKHGFGTYFDSYGLPPVSQHHIDRLQRNCKRFKWNKQRLQSFDSSVCGQYCIVFLYYMCKNKNLRTFCKNFSKNYNENDILIVKLFDRIVRGKNKQYVMRFGDERSYGYGCCNQICTSKKK